MRIAIREEVNAVLIAGDLMEDSSAYYESLGPLVDGFQKLCDEGIQVFAVGGNHDARAFERIAEDCRDLDGVHFVGRRGKWERVGLTVDGHERLRIEGWSFPDHRHPSDPAADYDLESVSGLPVIGLLHADLGSNASPYAPTTAPTLRGLPVNFWLLGHIHRPTLEKRPGEATILYPGSPQAMDFGETGWHGVWILESNQGDLTHSRIQTSTIRFEDTLEVEVNAGDNQDSAEMALRRVAGEHLQGLQSWERDELRCVVHRARLLGEWEQVGAADALCQTLPALQVPELDGLTFCFDEKLVDQTVLPLDLERASMRGGALGQLAEILIKLQSNSWTDTDWFESIYKGVISEYDDCRIEGDDEIRDNGEPIFGPPGREAVRGYLAKQARHLLLDAIQEVS